MGVSLVDFDRWSGNQGGFIMVEVFGILGVTLVAVFVLVLIIEG